MTLFDDNDCFRTHFFLLKFYLIKTVNSVMLNGTWNNRYSRSREKLTKSEIFLGNSDNTNDSVSTELKSRVGWPAVC